MEINVDDTTGLVYQAGMSIVPINDHSSIVTLDDSQQQEWQSLPPSAEVYFKDNSFTSVPWVTGVTPPPVDPATVSAFKEQVVAALQQNVGQPVTAETVNALLQYLGSLP